MTYYERPGMSNFSDMKKAGITRDDLLQHYMYCMEFLWQVCLKNCVDRFPVFFLFLSRDLVQRCMFCVEFLW